MRSKRWLRLLGVLVGLTALLFIAAACDDDDDDDDNGTPPEATATAPADGDGDGGGSVDVALADDFTVTPSVGSIAAGTITFNVTNAGSDIHNFRVIRSDLAIDALPIDAGAVDEGSVDVRGSAADLSGGGTETVEVDLEAGSYVLICNVPGHYLAGMTVAFTVE